MGIFQVRKLYLLQLFEPHAQAIMAHFIQAQLQFAALPKDEQPSHMGIESSVCVDWMVDYICDHREPVKLLLLKAEVQL